MPQIEANALVIRSKLKERGTFTIEKHPGLTLSSRGDGNGSWRVKYRPPGEKTQRWHTLSNDAKNADFKAVTIAKDKFFAELRHQGVDPKARMQAEADAKQEAARVQADTFGNIFTDWLERHAKVKKKSWRADETLYLRHIASRMGHLPAAEIKRAKVVEVLDGIAVEATGIQANKCQAVISTVFGWAVNEGRLEATPAYRIPKRGADSVRERVLTDDEIRRIWAATESAGVIGDAVRLCLILGQRRAEIADMPVSELDLVGDAGDWVIPGARTKNKVIHRVPLPPLAVALIRKRLAVIKGPFVFAGRVRGSISPNAVSKFVQTLNLGSPRATVHDMRRTVGTRLAAMGVPKEIRAKVLNHVSGAKQSVTDAVYNQYEGHDEKRRALQLWADHLTNIVAGKLHFLRWQS